MLRASALVVFLLAVVVMPDGADAGSLWRKSLNGCEPPGLFYSARHQSSRPPCCPTQVGVCPGGIACPASGFCPGPGVRCLPQTPVDRPNIVLVIADDQSYCHYGSAGECRSVESGTPVPAPETPNLDVLAGHGTVFPVAHNTAAWCYPSLNSILTGRYQRSLGRRRSRLGDTFVTVPSALRSLGGAATSTNDPFDPRAKIGGYCTYLGGKFTASAGDPGFDAGGRSGQHRLGRLECSAGPGGGPPRCGSDRSGTYAPFTVTAMRDFLTFADAMLYRAPGTPSSYRVQPFFAWYAPRIPHQPLRAPRVIGSYLFGGDGLSGLFDLGAACGGSCPSARAFDENNFGTVREYFANVYLVDENIREMRKFLERAGQPHCIGNDGAGRYEVASAGQCTGTWATNITPDPARNTVIMYLSDNGWHLPNSKHNFTENGYRTRLTIFDPRSLPQVPSWQPQGQVPPPPNESPVLAHSTDVLTTALGLALGTQGTQECPQSADGTRCDGRDLRGALVTNPGGPVAPETIRHSLCGHHTQRGTKPARSRYLLTRPGGVGRCVSPTAPACATSAQCGAGSACIGGRCLSTAGPGCTATAQCPAGSACLAGRCVVAPPCVDDSTCADVFGGVPSTCAAKGTKWCRNAPDQACGAHSDCPACPGGPGTACGRVCEPRLLKLYISPGATTIDLVDLFSDPDERGRQGRGGDVTLFRQMSSLSGPYGQTIRRMACCVENWWPEGAEGGTLCNGTCPADLTCNQ